MLIGILWVLASLFKLTFHSEMVAEIAEQDIARAASVRQPQQVVEAADLWLAVEPLSWEAYFAKGNGYLRAQGEDESIAAEAFRAARFLEPNQGALGLREGEAWLSAGNVARAFNAWNWMLDRRSENDLELRKQLFQRTWSDASTRKQLIALSETQPALRLMVYDRVELKAFVEMFSSDLSAEGFGIGFWQQVPVEKQHRWVNALGWSDFEKYIRGNPHLAVLLTYWPLRFEGLLGDSKFSEAIELLRGKAVEPGIPGDVEDVELVSLERQYNTTKDDLFRGLLLVKKYITLEDESSALELLRDIRSSNDQIPEIAHYWEGELSRRAGDEAAACAAWSRWLLAKFSRSDA